MQLEDMSKDQLIELVKKQETAIGEYVAIPLGEFKDANSNSSEFEGIKPLPVTPSEALKELAGLFYLNVECVRAELVVGMVEAALQPVQQPAPVVELSDEQLEDDFYEYYGKIRKNASTEELALASFSKDAYFAGRKHGAILAAQQPKE